MVPALQVGTEDERRNRVVSLKSLVATVVLLGVDGPSPTGAGIAPCCRECDREILRGLVECGIVPEGPASLETAFGN